MKKLEMIKAVEDALGNKGLKTNKAIKEAISAIMNEYKGSNSGAKNEIAQTIEIEGIMYAWCARHNLYEIVDNFSKNTKRTSGYNANCKLSDKVWLTYDKSIKDTNKLMSNAIDKGEFDKVAELNNEIKRLKDTRGGNYNFEDDKNQFPKLQGYDYDAEVQTLEV